MTGDKVAVKIDSIGAKKVFYKAPSGGEQLSVGKSQVYLIIYEDGGIYTVNPPIQTNTVSDDEFNSMPIIINAGVGYSSFQWQVSGINPIGHGPVSAKILSVTPAYNCTIDYSIFPRFSLGVGGAYQSLTDIPIYNQDNYATWELEKIIKYSFTTRFLYHFVKIPKYDAYIGLRTGMTTWKEQILYNNLGPQNLFTTIPPYSQNISFQILFGYRIFPIYNVGIHFELGIGNPYLVEGGITFRFKTKKG